MLVLTTMIGKFTSQFDSKGEEVKQSDKSLGEFPTSIGALGNNEKYDPPKPGERLTKMFRKQMKCYCAKCNRGKGFWGWHEEKSYDDNYITKSCDNSRKRENSGTP